MIRIEDIETFIRVTQLGNFSEVAREIGILPGQVSAAIARLEKELDTRLFVRSTRSLRITSEGSLYLPYAQEILEIIKASKEHLQSTKGRLSGEIKVSMPSDIGRNLLLPMISGFCKKHSDVSVRLFFTDSISNIYQNPVDIVLRYGVLDDKSYIALPLVSNNRRIFVASPIYLEYRGIPKDISEIRNHDCITFSIKNSPYEEWHFLKDFKPEKISVKSKFICDDSDAARRLALDGLGIIYTSKIDVFQDILNGNLVQLFTDLEGELNPLNFICPHRDQISLLAREFYSYLKIELNNHLNE